MDNKLNQSIVKYLNSNMLTHFKTVKGMDDNIKKRIKSADL